MLNRISSLHSLCPSGKLPKIEFLSAELLRAVESIYTPQTIGKPVFYAMAKRQTMCLKSLPSEVWE